MTYGKVNKAASSRKQGNHPFRHKLHTRMPPQSFFTSWTPNKKLLGRTALKRNTSFPRSNLRNKTWNLKTRKKNSCPPTPYSMNEGSVAFSSHHPGSLAESTVGAVVSHRCAVTAPRLSWMPPAGHVFTAPHLPITHPSHPTPLREPREQRQKVWWNKPGWQHGWKNEETSDRAMFSCMQNNVVFIPSHHVSALLTQVSGPSRHHVPQGEDAIKCEQKLSKWWLVNNASKRLIRKRNRCQHCLSNRWKRQHFCTDPSEAAEHAARPASPGPLALQSKSKCHSLIKLWFLTLLPLDTYILHPALPLTFPSTTQTTRELL